MENTAVATSSGELVLGGPADPSDVDDSPFGTASDAAVATSQSGVDPAAEGGSAPALGEVDPGVAGEGCEEENDADV